MMAGWHERWMAWICHPFCLIWISWAYCFIAATVHFDNVFDVIFFFAFLFMILSNIYGGAFLYQKSSIKVVWQGPKEASGHINDFNRSCPPEVFLGKDVLKNCSKFTREHLCRSLISIKLLCFEINLLKSHFGMRVLL